MSLRNKTMPYKNPQDKQKWNDARTRKKLKVNDVVTLFQTHQIKMHNVFVDIRDIHGLDKHGKKMKSLEQIVKDYFSR